MRLVFATKDLALAGRSFEGFPLLIGSEGWPVEPAQSFLWHTLIESGEALSDLTWEAYGRRLYDYFAFLEANGLAWNEESPAHGLSILSRYRDWSSGELALDPKTVNSRLALIVKFYRWAKQRNLITVLPFGEKRVRVAPHSGLLSHVAQPGAESAKASVMVRDRKRLTKFLTKDQVKVCVALDTDPSHQILFHLMVRTGLRSCEARSFPLKYVFNPRLKNGLRPRQMVSVALDPSDMHIKYDRPRTIDVPWSLMESMWSYSLHQREVRKSNGDGGVTALLLTNEGRHYSKDSVVDVMKSYERKCGFYVRAHMLRHTYGTYTLLALRKSKEFEGEPLLYVRDRLGHSDVQTTMIYLHLINQLEAQSVLAHEDEIDMMFVFDLLTFTCLGKSLGDADSKRCLELQAPSDTLSESGTKAVGAFMRQIYDIHRAGHLGGQSQDAGPPELYKVAGVQKVRDGWEKIEERVSLDADSRLVRFVAKEGLRENEIYMRQRTEQLSRMLGRENLDQVLQLADILGDSDAYDFVSSNGLDLSALYYSASAVAQVRESSGLRLFGSLQLQQNWDRVFSVLRKHQKAVQSESHAAPISLSWMAPASHELWGRSARHEQMCSAFSDLSKTKSKGGANDGKLVFDAKMLIPVSASDDWPAIKRAKADCNKARLLLCGFVESEQLAPLEAIVIHGKCAVVVYHLILPALSPVPIPFGFISEDPAKILNVENLINRTMGEYVTGNTPRFLGSFEPPAT